MYFLIICCECVHWETVNWIPYDLSSSYFWFKLYLPYDFRSTPITLASTFCCVLYLLLCLKQPLVWAVLCVSLWLKPLLLLMRALPITMTWASLAVCCTYPYKYNISSFYLWTVPTPMTLAAPALAANMERIPVPHPTSNTTFPRNRCLL